MTDRLARAAAAAALLLAAAAARAGSGALFSGSAYVDYARVDRASAKDHAPKSFSIDASMKVGVDITDDVSFTAKVCVSCHGIDMEHIAIEFTPKSWFNLQAGRIVVPFGDYAQRIDPSGHKTPDAPLIFDMGRMAYGERAAMNLGVLPQPYVDTGLLLYGTKWLGPVIQLWYGAYAVSGLKGGNDLDWISMRSIYYVDNNAQPGYGGRVTLTYSGEPKAFVGDVSLGASGTAGRYDKSERLQYAILGADASMRLGPVTLRGEYAYRKTDLNPDASGYPYQLVDPWFVKEGWYAELEHPLGKYVQMVYRYDALRRVGAPLPGANADLTPDSSLVRYTVATMITPAQNVFVKAGWEWWQPTDFPAFQMFHVGLGGAF